eukprot:761065-Hanusia_phi.AAC.1
MRFNSLWTKSARIRGHPRQGLDRHAPEGECERGEDEEGRGGEKEEQRGRKREEERRSFDQADVRDVGQRNFTGKGDFHLRESEGCRRREGSESGEQSMGYDGRGEMEVTGGRLSPALCMILKLTSTLSSEKRSEGGGRRGRREKRVGDK